MSANIIIGKHTLESLTSGMYADSYVVFREYIQNSVDSIDEAIAKGIIKKGDDKILIRLSPLEKRITIHDNGTGIPAAEVEKTLISIGNSKKTSEKSRGFRGIGRLSALSYCEKLIFLTSFPNEKVATRIEIDAEKLGILLAEKTDEEVSAIDVLKSVYSIKTFPESKGTHYFSVQLEGVKESSNLNNFESAVDYIRQTAPVPYNPNFVWGKEIVNRIKIEGYEIETYNIFVAFGTTLTQIYKPYSDTFIIDKNKNISDVIEDIEIIRILDEDGRYFAIGWIAKTNYRGSIYDKRIKGIRLRKGNILVGDHQTLNAVFKDARFNGWSIGEVFASSNKLIPNARRDAFEKNATYFTLYEQLSHCAASVAKEIRTASLNRNAELSNAINQIGKASEEARDAIKNGISSQQKGAISHKLKSAQCNLPDSENEDAESNYYKGIAFEELDMLMGKLKGATSYKALNAIDGITVTEKKILERVLNAVSSMDIDNTDEVINGIINEFSNK